jgi:ketosteroid isomerase-like protein
VSVWRRRPAGAWRVAVDVGVTTPQPAADAGSSLEYGRPLAAVPDAATAGSPAPAAAGDNERDALLAADRAFAADVAARGAAAGYAAHLGEGARLLRDGKAPVVGVAAIRAALVAEALKVGWQPAAGGVASSGDLGYTYGTATFARAAGGPTRDACYLRLWERAPGGDWKIVLDLLSPLPPPPPESG